MRRHAGLLIVLALVVALVPAEAEEAEARTHVVHVGALKPAPTPEDPNAVDRKSVFNYTGYYPDHLKIHSGDTVRWEWQAAGYFGWHGVTFVPEEMDAIAVPDSEGHANHAQYRKAIRPDDIPGGIALGERFLMGRDAEPKDAVTINGRLGRPSCGAGPWHSFPAQQTCVLSSTSQHVSASISDGFLNMVGLPKNREFSVKVDLGPGRYRYHCNIHPGMTGAIEVVPDADALPSDEQVAAERKESVRLDTQKAQAVFDRMSDPANAPYDPSTGEWTVHAGTETDDGNVDIVSFLPASLELERGEKIRYVGGTTEPNTVTFPNGLGGSFALAGCSPTQCNTFDSPRGGLPLPGAGLGLLAFPFLCDPDEPESGIPGSTVGWTRVETGCAIGQLEWGVSPYMTDAQRAPGDLVTTSGTFHNSGMLMNEELPEWYSDDPRPGRVNFPATFSATFPVSGRFTYACLAHPDFMTGSVSVI